MANELERRTAAYPDEIADRLIKVFSTKGDTVLDPFLGSGTTMRVAMQNDRNSIGYEIDSDMLTIVSEKMGIGKADVETSVQIFKR